MGVAATPGEAEDSPGVGRLEGMFGPGGPVSVLLDLAEKEAKVEEDRGADARSPLLQALVQVRWFSATELLWLGLLLVDGRRMWGAGGGWGRVTGWSCSWSENESLHEIISVRVYIGHIDVGLVQTPGLAGSVKACGYRGSRLTAFTSRALGS